jgi:hypothetical protein
MNLRFQLLVIFRGDDCDQVHFLMNNSKSKTPAFKNRGAPDKYLGAQRNREQRQRLGGEALSWRNARRTIASGGLGSKAARDPTLQGKEIAILRHFLMFI